MSGGYFDYSQRAIEEIAEKLENTINNNGKPIPKEEWDYWEGKRYKEHPEEAIYRHYSDEVISKFKEGLSTLKKAYIYTHEIDYLISGDTGEDSFLKRLNTKLTNDEK